MHQFSIITPTYNRAKYLPDILECLKEQGEIDLQWIIIDDGSTDNTREIVSQFSAPFNIIYEYQKNLGKPRAVNRGVSLADSCISQLLDSDDTYIPNIFSLVWQYYNHPTGRFHEDCVCLAGLCVYDNGEIIGDRFPHDYYVSNIIEYCTNREIKGDKCEFYLTSILKKYPFPIVNNEKFIAEGIVWNRIALEHKTLYINQIFQKKVFLKGGLSDQPIWENNPHSSELYFNEATNSKLKLTIRLKNSAKYIAYGRKNKKKLAEIFLSSCNKRIFALGLVFSFFYRMKKYFKIKRKTSKNWKKITNE